MTYRQPFRGEWPITQGYGEKITSGFHTGIDYGCPMGTEIMASADGMVVFAGWDATGYGLCVIIRHTEDRSTLYAHLSKIHVVKGEAVKQGRVIGLSGKSGNSTGPHLHFEARRIWTDWTSHFNPMFLPLISVDDSIKEQKPVSTEPKKLLPAGEYKVACDKAWVRTWPALERSYLICKGERVYIFEDIQRNESALPFHYIGAGRAIAEYDSDGTQILEK